MGVLMKKYITSIVVGCAFFMLLSTAGFGQLQKLAQTGMKFLSVATDARASAMGDAVTALEGHSSSMFFNPSGMARLNSFANVSLGQVSWIADIYYSYGSAAFSPAKGHYGVFGITFLSVDYGIFKGTIRDPGEQGFKDTGDFSPSATAIGFGYAKALSDKFSVGGNIKYVTQNLGNSIIGFDLDDNYLEKSYSEDVYAYDFGLLYRTGFESLTFGMCIRNFSEEVKYEDEGFQLPLSFKIGLSMNVLDIYQALDKKTQSLLLSVDAVHPRDYPEQLNIGAEYLFMRNFALRLGYSSPNDEHGLSAGFGFQQTFRNYMLAFDYAYTPFELFNDVHRFSVHFSL